MMRTAHLERSGTEPLRDSADRALPRDVVDESARRLAALAAFASWALLVTALLPIVVPQVAATLGPWVRAAILLPACVFSAVIAYVAARSRLSGTRALDLAMAFHVVTAAALASIEGSRDGHDVHWPTLSGVGALALVVPIVVPTTKRRALLASSIATSLHPIAVLAYVHAGALEAPTLGDALVRFGPDATAVAVGVYLTGIVHRLGDRLARARELGSYRLIERLGEGGMGEVWHAAHRLLRRDAAIKLIRPDFGGGVDALRARFEREALAMAGLRSPHTVQIYDYGQADDGRLYYAMELLQGLDLERLVTRYGPLPPERVIHVLRQAAQSLAEAHEIGLVHRDVKPSNIVLGPYGGRQDHTKVLDFGLVRIRSEENVRVTAAGEIPGTPAYLAPEAAMGRDVDARADLYALGCVAYFLLTGTLVFDGRTAIDMAVAHAVTTPTAPSGLGIAVPRELEAIVLRLLAKSPSERFLTAGDLEAALAAIPVAEPWTEARAAAWWRDRPATPPAARSRQSAFVQQSTLPDPRVAARQALG